MPIPLSRAFVPHASLDPFSGNNIIKPLQRALSVTEGGTPTKLTVSFKEGKSPPQHNNRDGGIKGI